MAVIRCDNVLIILIIIQVSAVGSSWYRGCYILNSRSSDETGGEDAWNQSEWKDVSTAKCLQMCKLKGYRQAGVSCGRDCNCRNNTDGWTEIVAQKCRTSESPDDLSCGQKEDIWHIFSLDGPHIENLTASVDADWVIVEIPVALDILINLSQYTNIIQDSSNQTWSKKIVVTWNFGSETKIINLTSDKSVVYNRVQHAFTKAGTYIISVTVTNEISSFNTSLTVSVLGPAPFDLQITNYVDPGVQPSCIPSTYGEALLDGLYFTVFEGDPFILEASVTAGHNLTFTYLLKTQNRSYTVKPENSESGCEGRACYITQKELSLKKKGVYPIIISVENQFGRLNKSLTVIVIEWRISNLSFSLLYGGSTIVNPDHAIRFYIQVEITSRLNATLQVDFDDGHLHVAELEDTNSTSMALKCNQGEMVVSSSYGKGCILNIEFEHSYAEEGVFRPSAYVFKGEVGLEKELDTKVSIMSKVHGARMQSERAVAVNKSTDFQVHLSESSQFMKVNWVVMDTELNVLSDLTTESLKISKTFNNAGLYTVKAMIENLVSSVSAVSSILVQVPLMGAYVSCGKSKFVSRGEDIECVADILDGSNPKFSWKFEAGQKFVPTVNKNLSSVARYSFDKAGRYNVSVLIFNDISKIVAYSDSTIFVENPVTCVSIISCCPTKYQEMSVFKVTYCQGTMIQLEFDFGKGRQEYHYEFDQSKTVFYTGYTFESTGIHNVTVFAYNRVSEVSHTTQVLVQEDVTDLEVEVFNDQVLQNVPIILIVKSKGAVFRRHDLVYRWEFSDGKSLVSASPIVGKIFSATGSHNVNFTASNVVGSFHKKIQITVRGKQDDDWIIRHDVITRYGEAVQFSLQGISVEANELYMDFGDGESEMVDIDEKKCSHTYSKAGLYTLQATVVTDKSVPVKYIYSIILVEELITGLQLLGPQIVEIGSLQRNHMWQAGISTGTNIIYHWRMGDDHRDNTTINKFIRGFPEPGVFTLSVTLVNDLSHQEANMKVTVQYPIIDISVNVPPSVLGKETSINITVVGGKEFFIEVHFGDGEILETSSENLENGFITTLQPAREGTVPIYLVHLTHTYKQIRSYDVKINVSNLISSAYKTKEAVLHEPIGDIILETESPAIISILEPVTVKVTVGSGQNLTYEWDFSNIFNPTKIISEGNTSIATHSFGFQGDYQVSVKISNPYYSIPVHVSLPFKIVAVEEIQNVYLEVVNKKNGATLEGIPPNRITDEIKFKASCWEGSDVDFLFDFDDGSTVLVPGVEDMYPMHVKGYAVHQYRHEGVFNVSVTARNPLGNVTAVLESPFYVQAPSFGLKLDQLRYYTRLGNATILRANFSHGTNVTFDWKLGDQSDIISDGGPVVNHTYKARGVYEVVVIARNKVSNQTATATVHVETEIQGIDLNVSNYLIAASEEVTFTVFTFPESATVSYYLWNFGETGEERKTNTPYETHTYSSSGKFIVTVKAYNNISHIESKPIEVQVMLKVKRLEISYHNDSIVNKSIEFTALFYEGSDLTFTWSFGDGSPDYISENPDEVVRHTYNRIGVFYVVLTASNLIGTAMYQLQLFVLDKVCKPPKIVIHGQEIQKINRSDPLFIEAEMKTMVCDLTKAVTYQWTIYNSTDMKRIIFKDTEPNTFNRKILYLPPLSMVYGNYTIEVKVKAKGTIVYVTSRFDIEVVASPLFVSIKGGVSRDIERSGTVVLDGSNSADVDLNSYSSLSFNWSCSSSLTVHKYNCFKVDHAEKVNHSAPVMSFPASWLNSDIAEFLFILTVTTKNRPLANASQILNVYNSVGETLQASIYCPQCERGIVNANERLSLQVVCPNCPPGVSYIWTVDIVNGEPDVPKHRMAPCLLSDTTASYDLLQNANNSRNTVKIKKSETSNEAGNTGVSYAGSSTATKSTLNLYGIEEGTNHRARSIDKSVSMATNSSPAGLPLPGQDKSNQEIPDISISENPDIPSSRRKYKNTAGNEMMYEGMPGESGSSGGRFSGLTPEEFDGGKRTRTGSSVDNGSGDQDKDKVYDQHEKENPDYIEHIMAKQKSRIFLRESQTLTGFRKQSLVLKPKALKQGRTYVINVDVFSEGDEKGMASTAFVVNKSPIKGDCEISADEGIEMVTRFRVYCREWQDEHTPLQYEVSYNLEAGGMKYLIYRGLQRDIHFTLPAGNINNRYKVNLFIDVLDSIGAKTSICSRLVRVQPKVSSILSGRFSGKISPEQLIYEDLVRENGVFASATDHADDRMAKVLIRYLALRLNKLPPIVKHNEILNLRTSIRTDLLQKLLDLPVRNELEVLQTIQALVSVTEVSQELNKAGIDLAVKAYRAVLTSSQRLYQASRTPCRDLLTLAVEVGSHIIRATADSARLDEKDAWFYKRSLVLGIDTMEHIIKNDILYHAIGEGILQLDAAYVATLAGRFEIHNTPELIINETKAILPSNMDVIFDGGESEDEFSPYRNCYQAQFTRYRHNPYTFVEQERDLIKSEVCSLQIFSCSGQPKEVSGLLDNNMVQFEIPRLLVENDVVMTHQLLKSQMSLHQFNMSHFDIQQFLNIHIQFVPITTEGRLFPFSVLISYKKPPSPWEYILKKDYEAYVNEIKIFLPAGFFNVTGEYFIGIVDARYNAGRPKKGEITARNYTFKLWWTKCMYWNQNKTQWSDNGCWATDKSTYHVTHCRCNHLSTFGCSFNVASTLIKVLQVDDFFDPNENLVCISLVGTIICIYAILLLLCHKADVHDAKKGDISYLQDNSLTDQQKYEVTIETGFRRGAGTTAKISIILHGEEGMSETRELISDDDRPLFERNSRDKFIMTLPNSIGKIWKIQIWHNNFGSSPSWYLSRVIVKDLNNGNIYYFISEKWLAVEEDDGKVEREFLALEGNMGFKKVMWAKGTQYMADYHLWTSLFTRPSYSQFTRKQRLTCCLTMMLIYMCLNVIVHHRIQKEYRGEFGLLDLSWRNVIIGTLCCASVFPVHLLITFLFRRSKQQVSDIGVSLTEELKDDLHFTSGKPNERILPEVEDLEPVQPVMTYSILDQSILNWPRIQDWAQKQWIKRHQNSMTTNEDNEVVTTETSATNILNKRAIGSEIDQASSGFEDSNSTDPRPQRTISSQASSMRNKTQSVSSTGSQKSSVITTKNTYSRIFLPHWFQYVAWSLCIMLSIASSVITVWYGFRFGKTKSIMWLQSLYVTVIICVFVIQPLMILLTVLYTAIKYRKDPTILDHKDDGYFGEKANLEIMRRKKEKSLEIYNENEEIDRGVAARQRSRYLRFARPPQEKQLIEARKKIMKEKKAVSLIRNTSVVTIMFLLICIIAYGKDTNSPFYLNEAIKNILIRDGNPSFDSIDNASSWYNWTQHHLITTLYKSKFVGNITSHMKQLPLFHGTSYIIGEVNIRQMKVKEERCIKILPQLPVNCRYDYSLKNTRTSSLGENSRWKYRQKSLSFLMSGKHGVYDNSGYVLKLNHSGNEAISQILDLTKQHWIDQQTRAIIIEFTLFNAPTKLFTSVLLLLELPSTGGAFPSYRVTSTYLFRYITLMDNFVLTCELVFILLTIWKLKIEVCDIIKMRKRFFHNGWKILELLVSFVSISYITCYAYRFLLVSQTVDQFQSTYYEQFVDVSYVAVWDEIMRSEVGFLLFLILLTSLRLLKYNKTFAIFEKVYRRVHKEILLLLGLMAGLLIAFSSMGHILFGTIYYGFRDVFNGVFTMSVLLTGRSWDIESESSAIYATRIFLLSFSVFVTGLLTAYVIAFLSFRFKIYKRRQGKILVMNGKNTITFYWQRLLFFTGLRIEEEIVEQENTLPPEFTMAEIEYQVDELFFRISALSGSHGLPEKMTTYFTDSDGTYGVGDDGISSGGSEIHPADEERLEHRVQKIEDNLCSQEPYLARLLNIDSIGTDYLSQEREKQLRSHLELEIFRQLQIQRQDPLVGQVTGSEFKEGASGSSTEMSTPSTGGNRKQQEETNLNNAATGMFASPDFSSDRETAFKRFVSDNVETSNNIQQEQNPTLNSDIVEEIQKNITRVRPVEGPGKFSTDHSIPDTDRIHLLKHQKLCDNTKQLAKPDLPSKPNFKNTGIRDVTTHEVTRPKLLNSPALRQLRSSFYSERSSFKGESNSGSSITTESSSGSEQDAIHGMHRSMGKRNLRKTKSRGKGKGSVNLSPALLDELETETRDNIDDENTTVYKITHIHDGHDAIPEHI